MTATILVIDDVQDVRENVAELLELSGHHVLQAEDGYAGIRMAKQHGPDLIVCDIMMPGIDGYGVAEILARHRSTQHIPLIYLTAKAESIDFKKGLQKGAVDYITKPFEGHELVESVALRLKQISASKPRDASDTGWKNWVEYLYTDAPVDLVGTPYDRLELPSEKVLFAQKEQANHVYFIRSGAIRWEYMDALGRSFCFNLSRGGDFVGWTFDFQEGSHAYTAIAVTPCELVRIPMVQVQELLLSQPGMALTWGEIELEQQAKLMTTTAGLLFGTARQNLARVLLSFAEWDGNHWVLDLPREILAKSTGLAYETVIRLISQFKADGLLVTKGRRISLLDRNGILKLQN